ncbi:MAG: aldo/keto reductase [Parachlamydiaceae bacterium]|nr:aldo/keto reductase [Parachlamydiaceae bacterium]
MNEKKTKIPPLIYGTAWKKERTAELVEKAILYGFRGIDTACQPKHYNELGVGEALQNLKQKGIGREALYLQTKFTPLSGQDPSKIPYDPDSSLKEQVHQSFTVSLKNLGVEFIDTLLLHSPLPSREQTMTVWKSMEELYNQGVVSNLGLSKCYGLTDFQFIYNEARVKPSVLQNRFYNETDYDKMMRAWCHEKEIYYQSFWSLTANPHLLIHPLLRNIASTRSLTEAQIFFRFLNQMQIIPLIGTCSDKHMQEDLSIFDFTLTAQELDMIHSLL